MITEYLFTFTFTTIPGSYKVTVDADTYEAAARKARASVMTEYGFFNVGEQIQDVKGRRFYDFRDPRNTDWEPVAIPAEEATPARTPYDAAHVAVVDSGHTVTALYIPDPDHAQDPRGVLANITDRAYAGVEIVVQMTRFYKSEGAPVSGWVTTDFRNRGLDLGTRKAAAKATLREMVVDYFATRD